MLMQTQNFLAETCKKIATLRFKPRSHAKNFE